VRLLALVGPEAAEPLLAELLEQGWEGVVACEPAVARRAAATGLEVAAFLEGPGGEGLEAAAAALGQVPVLRGSGEPLALRLASPEAAEAFAAAPEPPEAVLWVAAGDEDPGEDLDDELEALLEYLVEVGFEGAVVLRGEDAGRYRALGALAGEVLSRDASWWDGSEDGY